MVDVLVDTNVLLDYLNEEGEWFDWSARMLTEAAHQGALTVNPIIYAEVSVGYASIEDVEDALPRAYFVRLPLP